jgi:hypothetical protein
MKVFSAKPEVELRIVRPNEKDQYYEFYVLEPVYIGSARRAGTQKVFDENGREHLNLNSALRDALESHGRHDMAQTISLRAKAPSRYRIAGMDLVEMGKWHKFAALRGLDVRSTTAMTQKYEVTPKELAELELTHDQISNLQTGID